MDNSKIDLVIKKSQEDAFYLLELTAAFLEKAASTDHATLKKYHHICQELMLRYMEESPFAKILSKLIDGVTNYYLTHFSTAQIEMEEAYALYKPGMPEDILGAICMVRGSIYRSIGDIDLAVQYVMAAIESLRKDGAFLITYAYSYYQLGETYVSIGEYESAIAYYEEALDVIKTTDDISANFRINSGLGGCYLLLGNNEKSERFLSNALSVEGISPAERARGYCDLGRLSIAREDYTYALSQLQESLGLRLEHNLEDAASTSMIYLAQVYLALNRADDAIKTLLEALAITLKYNALSKKIMVYRGLTNSYQQKGDLKLAYKYLLLYDNLNNERRTEQEHKIFNLKNNQIEKQKQEVHKKNILLRNTLDELAKVKNSRKSLIFSFLTAIVLVILSEVFLEPIIDSYAYNQYLSLGIKVLIALLFRPIESFYERIIFKKAMKLR